MCQALVEGEGPRDGCSLQLGMQEVVGQGCCWQRLQLAEDAAWEDAAQAAMGTSPAPRG